MMAQPSPVPRFRSKSDLAYEEVRRLIVAGTYAPGAVIGQAKLAHELGMSTTPLREALKRLAAEGLVELGAHRDAQVISLSREEAQNLYEIRLALDPLACSLAARHRGSTDLSRIDAALSELEAFTEASTNAALDANRRFHRATYIASANPTLVSILGGIWDKTNLYRQQTRSQRTPSATVLARVRQHHRDLHQAIKTGSPARASELALMLLRDSTSCHASEISDWPRSQGPAIEGHDAQ